MQGWGRSVPNPTPRPTGESPKFTGCPLPGYNYRPRGDVAQLGERRVRNAKVGSSILLVSTNPINGLRVQAIFILGTVPTACPFRAHQSFMGQREIEDACQALTFACDGHALSVLITSAIKRARRTFEFEYQCVRKARTERVALTYRFVGFSQLRAVRCELHYLRFSDPVGGMNSSRSLSGHCK
jgi:hypothetical protein